MSTFRHLGPQRALVLAALLSTAVFWALLSPPALAAVLDPRGIQSETLHNGLRLIVANDPDARVVAAEIVVKVGAADEPPGQKGIAHLLEHVLWCGAPNPDSDPRMTIEQMGGVVDAGTLRDYTRFYATVPAGNLDLVIAALGETVLQTDYDENIVARERRIIIEESAMRAEDPRTVLNALAFAELYTPAHPYSSPIEGTLEDLSQVDAARLALFHQTWYVPNNIAVIVSGDAPFDVVRDLVASTFGRLSPAALPSRSRPLPPRPSPTRLQTLELPIEKAYVMAAFVGPDATEHTSVSASDLLATLLTHGPTGRLVFELQEKRSLALGLGIDFLTQRDRALFGVWAICEPDSIDGVREAIRTQLSRLAREPVPPAGFATAKRLLAAGFAFANETPADRAATLGFYEAIDSYRAASYYLPWVAAIRPQAVAEVAAWYSGEPVWIILRPEIVQ
ncbi:MAG: insulinase family protein [Armatimonadetes bacterium]|nr:insulinase family protein [Armatimonadota bacterium]